MDKDKPNIFKTATIEDPFIAASIEARFRFADIGQAQNALDKIIRNFLLAKDSPPVDENGKHNAIKIFIRGFAVGEEEKAKGYRGNFALISIKKVSGGRFALIGEKLDIDVSHHPERERPKSRYPNWGHPILRAVEKGKIYPDLKHAKKELRLLHEEYPEATIPGEDTLHVLIFTRKENKEKPLEKIVIKLQVQSEGGVKLALKGKGAGKASGEAKKPLAIKPSEPSSKPEIRGKFTGLVVEKRKKRKG